METPGKCVGDNVQVQPKRARAQWRKRRTNVDQRLENWKNGQSVSTLTEHEDWPENNVTVLTRMFENEKVN